MFVKYQLIGIIDISSIRSYRVEYSDAPSRINSLYLVIENKFWLKEVEKSACHAQIISVLSYLKKWRKKISLICWSYVRIFLCSYSDTYNLNKNALVETHSVLHVAHCNHWSTNQKNKEPVKQRSETYSWLVDFNGMSSRLGEVKKITYIV